jgi:hypothetical protein
LHSSLRRHVAEQVGADLSTLRSFTFDAPGEQVSLVFFFQKLATSDSVRAVKDTVERVHQLGPSLAPADVEVIGAMPHLHTRAHEDYTGPSPGSEPRPVYPDQLPGGDWQYRYYQPINPRLDLARPVREAESVRVAVLDTRVDLQQAAHRGAEFRERANNRQLVETVERLAKERDDDPRYRKELDQIAQHHDAPAPHHGVSEPPPRRMPDHALFVAGLIDGIAPTARITLEPVLDEMGVGDLSILLLGLQRVLERKQPDEPQIVNLSLGFLPHPARLPAAWYGLPRPHDPLYMHAEEMFDPARDSRWVAAHRAEVDRGLDLLQAGLAELARYLSLNNCLVVAAAGNDSLAQVEARRPRMEPRLPARFETVLGVAATTSDPRRPAPYSNVGDERELGDHVATFGGGMGDGFEPEDGVIGIYSGEFPFERPNETGWAYWSGTSFATAIVSGIAANLWAERRAHGKNLHANELLAELHAEASAFGPYVSALRTPSIEVQGRWGR